MEKIELNVDGRSETGKGVIRRMRAEGMVPGIYYSHGNEARPLKVARPDIARIMRNDGMTTLLVLKSGVSELNDQYALIKDMQVDPVREEVLHFDLQGVSLDEKVGVTVPLVFEGTPAGERQGGSAKVYLYEVDIECRADTIPSELVVDISGVELDQILHVGDIPLPDGVEFVTEAEVAIFACEVRRAAVIESEEGEDVEGEEGADGEGAGDDGGASDSDGGDDEGDG